MKIHFPLIFLLVTQICMSQKSAAPSLSLQKLDENSSQLSQDSLLKIKKIKRELATIKLLKLQDSLLKALAIENKIEAERIKNALPRTEYYKNGQNGIELIAKQNDNTIIVSTYDSRPSLKEAIAKAAFDLYNRKIVLKDKILTIKTPEALVTGNCKIRIIEKCTNISFYFQKIVWNSGLTEIHEGEAFIALPSSEPFVEPSKLIVKKI